MQENTFSPRTGFALSLLGLFSGLLFIFPGCGKKSSSDSSDNTSEVNTGQLRIGIQAANFQEAGAALKLTDTPAGPPFRATSIFSGAPESFSIYVKKIELSGTVPASADKPMQQLSVTVFEDTAGKPIVIDGANVDLTGLFKTPSCIKEDGSAYELKSGEKCECGLDAKGNLLKKVAVKDEKTGKTSNQCDAGKAKTKPVGVVDVTAGTFTTLRVTYSSKASIKGCLTGYFRTNATGVGDTAAPHTYCTRADGSLFSGTKDVTLSTFEDKEAEVMDTALSGVGGPNAFTADQNDTQVTYSIEDGFKVETGKASQLTLLIDTNRMLRFEAANRSDSPVLKTGWPTTRPYFFSTVFESSSFVFVGEPGEIRGYDWNAYACEAGVSPCKGSNNSFYVEGWLTTIYDKKGEPMIMSYMPDDDSTLTVIKGSNQLIKKDPKTGSQERYTDPNGFVKNANGSLTLNYNLGENSKGSITLPKEPTTIDETVDGSYTGFQSLQGEFSLTRRL